MGQLPRHLHLPQPLSLEEGQGEGVGSAPQRLGQQLFGPNGLGLQEGVGVGAEFLGHLSEEWFPEGGKPPKHPLV